MLTGGVLRRRYGHSTAARLRWRRVAPGYYEARAQTTANGVVTPVTVTVEYIETDRPGDHYWTIRIQRAVSDASSSPTPFTDRDGAYVTKRQAVDAAAKLLAVGFMWTPHLGWSST